jgi:hypothetical protein
LKLLARAALGLLLLYLLVSVPRTSFRALRGMVAAARSAGESPLERRRRTDGPEYTEAVEAIRKAIPADGAYVLVNGASRDDGARLWVRFHLAPRRAVYVGNLQGLRNPRRSRAPFPADLPWVVVARGRGNPPELYGREAFLSRMKSGDDR